ncbi:MAG: glycosyltransferase family 39 protein [Candidatus Shapirobacteria bacterium]|nr:glycosyltransferase family 39 protein [Candidatus Shapirobacteria bacterium]
MIKKLFILFPLLILILFCFLFLFRAIGNITTIPFHDYDEAHRAEGARNMAQEGFFLSPLVGNPYGKSAKIAVSYSSDNTKTLFAQTGRPPLVFSLMAASFSVFGDYEWAYRLPSLILGLVVFDTIALAIYFLAQKKPNLLVLAVALLAIITSYDWWLSAQMAHLDTAVSLFTALSVFLLILFAQNKNKIFLVLTSLFLALAILSKGQPAVIFISPLIYLLLIKKITIKETLALLAVALIFLLPWIISFDKLLGPGAWLKTYFGKYVTSPSATKIGGGDPTQAAPIFWYLRWWFDTLRPGIFLFGAFFLFDLVKKRLFWQKIALLVYIFAGFGLFSYAKSKVWWYVLPILPAISLYLYLAITDYLKEKKTNLINLSLAILLASLPLFLFRSNTISLAYGLLTTILVFLTLKLPITGYLLRVTRKKKLFSNLALSLLLTLSFLVSLTFFHLHFPAPTPNHPETRAVGQYFQTLSYPKSLWVEEDFPYEAILYYSKVGQLDYLDEDSVLDSNCQNYLVADKNLEEENLSLIFQAAPVRLYEMLTPGVNN